jgi:hypothetical protein
MSSTTLTPKKFTAITSLVLRHSGGIKPTYNFLIGYIKQASDEIFTVLRRFHVICRFEVIAKQLQFFYQFHEGYQLNKLHYSLSRILFCEKLK